MITRAMAQKIKEIKQRYSTDEINGALGLLGLKYSQIFTLSDVV